MRMAEDDAADAGSESSDEGSIGRLIGHGRSVHDVDGDVYSREL
jgi:hypothetical protein